MTSKKFDPSKPVEFVAEDEEVHPARIICRDLAGEYPLAAAVTYSGNDRETLHTFTLSGELYKGDVRIGLRNKVVEKTGWMAVYQSSSTTPIGGWIYPTRRQAEEDVLSGVQIVEVRYVETADA